MSCSVLIKNLVCKDEIRVLFDVEELRVAHKEKVAIVGANGVGKTTFLEILAGLNEFDGQLEIFHEKIEKKDDYLKVRGDVGYLFQDSNDQFLAPIVEDDVAFGLFARGLKKDEIVRRVGQILEEFGIAHLAKKVVYHLSGGEKKLVALAGVLVCEPKLLLLDEPTNGLDVAMQKRLSEMLQKIDKSMIVVSHNDDFVKKIVHKSYELRDGKLVGV